MPGIEDKLDASLFIEELLREAARNAGMRSIFITENPVKYPDDIAALQLRGAIKPTQEWAAQEPVVAIFRLKANNDIYIDTLGWNNGYKGYYTEEIINIAEPNSIDRITELIKKILQDPDNLIPGHVVHLRGTS